MNTTPTPPAEMVEVNEAEFFARLRADPRDIMPNHDAPDCTAWRVRPTGALWGWSAPGWRNPGARPYRYAVRREG